MIAALGMQPHPEGGHYVEVYRSPTHVQPLDSRGRRAALTTIFFLLRAGEISRWHRVLGSDEVWHFYEGDPLELLTAPAEFDRVDRHRLGPVDADADQQPVHIVAAGVWQAARSTGAYTLVGCTVGPGFDFADFQMLRDLPADCETARVRQPRASAFI